MRSCLGSVWSVAVGGGRCGVDQTFHPGITRSDKDVYGAVNVGPIAADGIQHRFRNRRNRGLVQDVIDAAARRVHGVEIEHVSLAEIDLSQNLLQIFSLAGGKIIYASNFRALF